MIIKKSEIRTVLVLSIIAVIICATGILLYNNLSSISQDVRSSYNTEIKSSIIIRQVLTDIREAENSVKAYNLSNEKEYLISFYTSLALADNDLNELKNRKYRHKNESEIIDSTVLLCAKKFELLKKQLYLENEEKITDELNVISDKVENTYKSHSNTNRQNLVDKKQEKESFVKRLFTKKKPANDTLSKTIEQLKNKEEQLNTITQEIKHTVQKVKLSQIEKLKEQQLYELQLSKENKIVMDDIRQLYMEMDLKEKELAILKIEQANQKMFLIKTLSISVSIVISLMLFAVSYYIFDFIRRKKQYELALLAAKENAEDLAKTKELFLANMSHEIKTPLNAIYGFTEQVLNSQINEKQKEQLTIVKKASDHLIKLITNILNYSKLQAGKIDSENSNFSVKQELQDIEALFRQQIVAKNIDLLVSIGIGVPDNIYCDVTKFKQLLFNLVGNAIKFTDKGFVKIDVSKHKTLINNQNALCIKITDTGIGIAENKIKKLFNEYEQANSDVSKKYGGTGLGLVITKKLLEQMNGTIELSSIEHKGTSVTIIFPYQTLDSKNTAKKRESFTEKDLQPLLGKKILIVDDEEYNRLLLKAILSKYHVVITEATNGVEAVSLTKENIYDLILMDINMPLKSGVDACKEIRKLNNIHSMHLPILASTAVILSEEKYMSINRMALMTLYTNLLPKKFYSKN